MTQRLHSAPSPSTNVHFYSSSGGNAGLACVHAARHLSRPATVVVPMTTKPLMMAKIRAAGAHEVIQHGTSWKEADTCLRDVVLVEATKRGEEGIYVPPFDHEDIWTGNSGMVDEIQRQLDTIIAAGDEQGQRSARPDVLVCSVGGGGLFNGIMQGAERVGWTDTTVLALETRGADSLNKSLVEGEHVTLSGITSKATSLGATRVSDRTYELATTKTQVKSVVLTDAEAAMGSWRLAEDERMMVELACGVNVALCYGGRLGKALGRPVRKDDKVVIVLCGGSNVTIDMLSDWKQEFGRLGDETSDKEAETVPSAADPTEKTLTNGTKH